MKLIKQNIPFTMVANEVLYRTDISLKAKGIFAYLFSKPEGWDFAAERIAKECKESRKAVLTALQELETAGLLSREKQPDGRMEYTITFAESQSPKRGLRLFSEPKVKKGTEPKGHGAESGSLSNTELKSNKDIVSNKEGINDLINLFEPVNPMYAGIFRNKTQRSALERIVEKLGVEKTEGAIRAAIGCFGKDYAPTITNPLELEKKMGSLASYLQKNKKGSKILVV